MYITEPSRTPHIVHEIAHVAEHSHFGLYLRGVAKVLSFGLFGLLALIIVQLAYPRSLTTPLLRVNGVHVGAMNADEINDTLAALEKRSFTLQAKQKNYQITYQQAGVYVDEHQSVATLQQYKWSDRLTPFSIFRRSAAPTVARQYDEPKLAALAEQIKQENTIPAKNATVQKTGRTYKVAGNSTIGATYQTTAVISAIKSAQPGKTEQVALQDVPVEPAITTDEAQTAISQVEQQQARKTYLKVDDTAYLIPAHRMRQFIAIRYNKKKDLLSSEYNTKAIVSYVASVADKVYQAPVEPVVTVRDGQTVKTEAGKSGRYLPESKTLKALIAGLKENKQTIEVASAANSLSSRFIRTYSSSSKGLQILLQDWQSDTGLSAGVVIRELGGRKRNASLNGSQSFLSASVAKLYLTDYLYSGISKGSFKSTSKLGGGMSVKDCIRAMIVVSNNTCYQEIGANRGWGTIASFVQAQGFTGTNLNPAYYSTTAQDTAWLLQKLQTGSLVTSSQRSTLLGYMRSQIYRSAIPAGSSGAVANKPGFYGGYWHDAGIVYHPKSTYVLVALTNGGSPTQIADLARRVDNFMDK